MRKGERTSNGRRRCPRTIRTSPHHGHPVSSHGTRSTVSGMSRSIDLAVIPGDGIGQEVVAEGLKVLSAVLPQDVKLETKEFDFGARRYHATGETLTDADLAALKPHDAILLGAIGDPSVPSGVLERGFLLKLRFAFDHHVNLRPSKLLPGVATPSPVSRRSTSSSSVRAPRGRTPATAAPSARAPSTRSPPRSPSTRPSVSSASSVTPSPAPRPAPARSSRWSTRTTC